MATFTTSLRGDFLLTERRLPVEGSVRLRVELMALDIVAAEAVPGEGTP